MPDDGTHGSFIVKTTEEDEELLYDELGCEFCDDITNSDNTPFATNKNQHTKKADFNFANDVAVCPTSTKKSDGRNITTSPHICGMCKLNYNEQRRLLGLGRSDYPRSRMQRKRGEINPCRIRKERHEKLRALFAYERYMEKLDREREFLGKLPFEEF